MSINANKLFILGHYLAVLDQEQGLEGILYTSKIQLKNSLNFYTSDVMTQAHQCQFSLPESFKERIRFFKIRKHSSPAINHDSESMSRLLTSFKCMVSKQFSNYILVK